MGHRNNGDTLLIAAQPQGWNNVMWHNNTVNRSSSKELNTVSKKFLTGHRPTIPK